MKFTTGLKPVVSADAGFEDYGFAKTFHIDKNAKKKILITGTGSYIGESFIKYCERYYPNIECIAIDMVDDDWRKFSFSSFDTIFHVAGIAHVDVEKIDYEHQKKYYEVNTDLAIETCQKAKESGVKQFIFMSSMIVYGGTKYIDEKTVPSPLNVYGDSKWQADKGVREFNNSDFHVAVLRSPMIYGKGSKGNYSILAKIARKVPVFPDYDNKRSMIYIENLCEFISLLILSGKGGIYFPQNDTYSKTSEIVKLIGKASNSPVKTSRMFNLIVKIASHIPGKIGELVEKAFGSSYYDQNLSKYSGLDYQIVSLEESIERTEGADTEENFNYSKQKGEQIVNIETKGDEPIHILVISQYFYPETFRINDIADEWVKRGYRVTVLTGIPNYPMGKFFNGYDYIHRRREQWNGIEIIRIPLIPRGDSRNKIFNAFSMAANYFSFVACGWWWQKTNNINADIIFTYEVSPMTQALIGCWYSRRHHIPHFLYVQDLWPENVETVTNIHSSIIIKPIEWMTKWIYKNSTQIFTTSSSFVKEIVKRGVRESKVHYWPQYAEEFYCAITHKEIMHNTDEKVISIIQRILDDKAFNIVFTGNIGKAQGLDILPKVAEKLKKIYTYHDSCSKKNNIHFIIVGDGRFQKHLEAEIKDRNVKDFFTFIPRQPAENIPYILSFCDVAFLSFADMKLWEMTIPAKLQSYMACGMPIIAAVGGESKRVIEESGGGICCEIGDVEGVVDALETLMSSDLKMLGENSRIYAQEHFNKKILMNEMDEFIKKNVYRKTFGKYRYSGI